MNKAALIGITEAAAIVFNGARGIKDAG